MSDRNACEKSIYIMTLFFYPLNLISMSGDEHGNAFPSYDGS